MRSILASTLALGFVVLSAAAPAAAADMRKFSRACLKSPDLVKLFAHNAVTPQAARRNYCACLGNRFGPAVDQKQADLMAAQIAGTLNDEQKQSFAHDQTLLKLSSDTMNQCLTATGLTVDPGTNG